MSASDRGGPARPRSGRPTPRARLRGWRANVAQVVIVVALVVFWQFASGDPRNGAILDVAFVSKPSLVWSQFVTWCGNGVMGDAVVSTLEGVVVGFVLGTVVGLAFAFAFAATRFGRTVLAPLVFLSYSVPRLAFAPMFIIWFGLGFQSTVALAVLTAFLYSFFFGYEGARNVPTDMIITTRLMGASFLQMVRVITVPSSLVWVAAGLGVSIPQVFAAIIFSEIYSGNAGLGALMHDFSDPDGLVTAIVVTGLLAIVLNRLVEWSTGRLMHWRTESSTGGPMG